MYKPRSQSDRSAAESGRDKKYVFYHVPKSGGTTIFNMIQRWPNIRRADKNKNHVMVSWNPPKINEIGITIVRHPYSRFESAFYHMVDCCDERFYYRHAKQSDCNTMEEKLGIPNFNYIFQKDPNRFLRALYDPTFYGHKEAKKVFHEFDIFKPQFYWLSDIFGFNIHPEIKKIFRQEHLREEFSEFAMNELNQYPNWDSTVNARISQDNIPLDDTSKAIIRNLYKNDFKHFKFDF